MSVQPRRRPSATRADESAECPAAEAASDPADLVWKALADATRRQILDLLRVRARTTGQLCSEFETTRFAVMKHIELLVQAGLVLVERKGRERWNYLNPVPIQSIYRRWIRPFEAQRAERLLDLKTRVETKRKSR